MGLVYIMRKDSFSKKLKIGRKIDASWMINKSNLLGKLTHYRRRLISVIHCQLQATKPWTLL